MAGSRTTTSRRTVVLWTVLSACILTASGCRSALEGPNPFVGRQVGADTSGSTASAVVHVRVPLSQKNVTKLIVSDSLYGNNTPVGTAQTFTPSQCALQGQEHICTATFSAPLTTNDVQVNSYDQQSSLLASGTFPLVVTAGGATDTAVLGGTIKSLAIQPFLGGTLSISQSEQAWIVARDGQGSVIVGSYGHQLITLGTDSEHLHVQPKMLASSADGESVEVNWHFGYYRSFSANLKASAPNVPLQKYEIAPASGILYYRAPEAYRNLSPGPVVVGIDGAVYFAINDPSGCPGGAGTCAGAIVRFAAGKFTQIAQRFAAGIEQMYVDQSGTGSIWMATYQTAGAQSGDLPVLTLPANTFSEGALRRLPPAFNHASGFFADDNAGEMWISRCEGTCGASGGTPYVVVTALAGRNKPVLHKLSFHCRVTVSRHPADLPSATSAINLERRARRSMSSARIRPGARERSGRWPPAPMPRRVTRTCRRSSIRRHISQESATDSCSASQAKNRRRTDSTIWRTERSP